MRNYAGSALMLIVTMAAAVGCYTINLRVSAERAEVDRLRNRLVADAREIRNLQVELRTRARFPEMQRWNDGVFQMSAPAAGQYLRSPLQLASYGAAPAPAKPDVTYAIATPDSVAVRPRGLVTASYGSATAPEAARLIRAGYTAAARADALGDAVTIVAAPQAAVPAPRPQPQVAAAKPDQPAATPSPADAPRGAPAAPIDILPEGGQ